MLCCQSSACTCTLRLAPVQVVGNMVVPYLFCAVMLENFFDSMEQEEQEEVRSCMRCPRPNATCPRLARVSVRLTVLL